MPTFNLEVTNNDWQWFSNRYPGMQLHRNGVTAISGSFTFDASRNDKSVTDSYEVNILLQASNVSELPRVIETAGRIKQSATKWGVPLIDVHSYPDGTACLCVEIAEQSYFPNGFSFPTFIETLVVPFFFAQSQFEKTGNWPWEAYSHGILGWVEWYLDQGEMDADSRKLFFAKLRNHLEWESVQTFLKRKRGIKGHNHCICGSKVGFRKCHPKVLRALLKIKQDFASI